MKKIYFLKITLTCLLLLSITGCWFDNDNDDSTTKKDIDTLSIGDDIIATMNDSNLTISVSGAHSGTISYSTRNPDVATIDENGNITLVGVGETSVIVTNNSSDQYNAQVKEITLTVGKGTLNTLDLGVDITKSNIDDNFTISVNGSNGEALTFTSSDVSIATVDNSGIVDLLGAGVVTIQATQPESENFSAQLDQLELTVERSIERVEHIQASGQTFAAIHSDGYVSAWGYQYNASSSRSRLQSSPAQRILAGPRTVYVVYQDGSMRDFGSDEMDSTALSFMSGSDAVTNVEAHVNPSGWAHSIAQHESGAATVWGTTAHNWDYDALTNTLDGSNPILDVQVAFGSFSALHQDGSVTTSDSPVYPVSSNVSVDAADIDGTDPVKLLISNYYSTTALHVSGNVTSWGSSSYGGDNSAVLGDLTAKSIKSIYKNDQGFAALHTDNTVTYWGSLAGGSGLNTGKAVEQIFSSYGAFAALHSDGSVSTWGSATYGGDLSSVSTELDGTNDVVYIYSTERAFAALHTDGSVTTWGSNDYGADSSGVTLDGSTPVITISSNPGAFAALLENGSVIAWGRSDYGNDSSAVSSRLDGSIPVVAIYGTTKPVGWDRGAFAALHNDGSVTTWGQADAGGDSSSVSVDLAGSSNTHYDSDDLDADGYTNLEERNTCASTPYSTVGELICQSGGNPDTDNDGIWDNVEQDNGTNPKQFSINDSQADINSDTYIDSLIIPSTNINVPLD